MDIGDATRAARDGKVVVCTVDNNLIAMRCDDGLQMGEDYSPEKGFDWEFGGPDDECMHTTNWGNMGGRIVFLPSFSNDWKKGEEPMTLEFAITNGIRYVQKERWQHGTVLEITPGLPRWPLWNKGRRLGSLRARLFNFTVDQWIQVDKNGREIIV